MTVVAPDGVQWHVGRRWLTRRFGLTWRRRGDIASESFFNLGPNFPDLGNLDFGEELLVFVALVAAALIIVPILFFGIELIILGALLAAGIFGRVLLRRPWIIQAKTDDPLSAQRVLEWHVRGWTRSRRLIRTVVSDLAAGREPPQPTLSP